MLTELTEENLREIISDELSRFSLMIANTCEEVANALANEESK